MFFIKVKSNHRAFYQLLTLNILINSSLCVQIPKRFLQYDDYYNDYNTYNNTSNTTSTSVSEDPGSYLLAWFFIFFFMGLYIICSMKKYPSIANRTDDVWKFMFFANNGILVAAGVNVFNVKNILLGASPFGLSSIVFLIGCFYYICKYCKECSYEKTHEYFDGSKISELNKIPCFVWSLVGLTDPCCRSESYTVTYYSDGTTESTYCCHCMWNMFIYIIKRLAVIFTFVSYYIFLVFYILFWFIAKGIFYLILNCQKENGENSEKQSNNQKQGIQQVNNLPNMQNVGNQVIINNINSNEIIYINNNTNNINNNRNSDRINFNKPDYNNNAINTININNKNNKNNNNNLQSIDNMNNNQEYLTLSPGADIKNNRRINNINQINQINSANSFQLNQSNNDNANQSNDLPERNEVEEEYRKPEPSEDYNYNNDNNDYDSNQNNEMSENNNNEIEEAKESENHNNESNRDEPPGPELFDAEI